MAPSDPSRTNDAGSSWPFASHSDASEERAGRDVSPASDTSSSWRPYRPPQSSRRASLIRWLQRYGFWLVALAGMVAFLMLMFFPPVQSPVPQERRASQGGSSTSEQALDRSSFAESERSPEEPFSDSVSGGGAEAPTEAEPRDDVGVADRDRTFDSPASASPTPDRSSPSQTGNASGRTDDDNLTAGAEGSTPNADLGAEIDPPGGEETSPNGSSEERSSGGAPAGTGSVEEPATLELGRLEVNSTPEDAEVRVNGTLVGRTPMRLDSVPADTYEVALTREGYETKTSRVAVRPDEEAAVAESLSARTGQLRVLARPWGSIYINGEIRAEDTDLWYKTELPVGTHEVVASHPALGQEALQVEIQAGEERSLVINLKQE